MAAIIDGAPPTDPIDITHQKDGGVLKTLLQAAPSAKDGVAVAEALEDAKLEPEEGDIVTVNYTGRLAKSRAIFDSTTDIEFSRGHGPLSFPAGQGKVVQGFDVAVLSMRVGETATFWIRQDYGYGATGAPSQGSSPEIEPETDLFFEITLLQIGGIAENLSKAAEREAEDRERLKLLRAEREELEANKAAAAQAKKDKAAADKAKAAEDAKAAADAAGGALTVKDVKKMNPKQLKAELKTRGLSIEGNKKVLADRLVAAI